MKKQDTKIIKTINSKYLSNKILMLKDPKIKQARIGKIFLFYSSLPKNFLKYYPLIQLQN